MLRQTKSAITRSRARWAKEGEKNTKYFLNLEKRHCEKKGINRLFVDDKIITDQNNIFWTFTSNSTNKTEIY